MIKAVGIYVGASKDAVREAREAIMAILNSDCDQDTMRIALQSLTELCSVKNTTITGNTLSGIGS